MTFEQLHRASQYVTLFLATLLLSVDATQYNRYAMLYPIFVGGLSVLAFSTVDRDPRRGMPRDVANFLSLLAFAFGLLEFYNDSNTLLLAIGHTLVYLMAIKIFLPKTVEDDWYLSLIGLVVAVIGVYASQSDLVGILLITWAVMSLWTFGLFFLLRESTRQTAAPDVTIRANAERQDPYKGLINAGFVLNTLGIAAATLVLGVGVFLLMPRWAVRGQNRFGPPQAAKHLTGFSSQVQLGRMGEILESDGIFMSVEFTDEDGKAVEPEQDILLRGLTFTKYEEAGWTRTESDLLPVEHFNPEILAGTPLLRQHYKMEPSDSEVLFGVRPLYRVRTQALGEISFNRNDGSIVRRDPRDADEANEASRLNKYDYTVISGRNGAASQPREGRSFGLTVDQELLQLPKGMLEPLKEIAAPAIAKLRPESRGSRLKIAQALQSFLRDGDYTYSLKMTKIENIDPVLDFLKNRKEGHCEYFASALTLLCRAYDVPARMVNGFKGGDWEGIGRVLHVREKHAHSWVEVLIGGSAETAQWVTLDPTPSRQRAEVVAKVGGNAVKFHYLTNPIRSFWTFGVVGFDADRQEKSIYGPLRELRDQAMRGFRVMGQMLRDLSKWFYFESYGQFFSVRGFFVSVLAMLALAGLFYVGAWLLRRILGLRGRAYSGDEVNDPGLAFYVRLVKTLASIGVERPLAETPREFARRAATLLESRPNGTEHADVPAIVVDLFYAKRFGAKEPGVEALDAIDARLGALEASIASAA